MDRHTSMTLLRQVRHKQAEAALPLERALQEAHYRSLQARSIRSLATLGLAAAGLGAMLRSLGEFATDPAIVPPYAVTPVVARVPVPVKPVPLEEKERKNKSQVKKGSSWLDFLAGRNALSPTGMPWYLPAVALAAGGGGFLGWKAMDALLDKARADQLERELEEAKQEFREALLAQFDEPREYPKELLKTSRCRWRDVGVVLDWAWKKGLLKRGDDHLTTPTLRDYLGRLTGLYGLYALAAGLGSGYLGYKYMNMRSRRKVLRKALQQRIQQLAPSIVYQPFAVPDPVPVTDRDHENDDERETS